MARHGGGAEILHPMASHDCPMLAKMFWFVVEVVWFLDLGLFFGGLFLF